MQTCGDMYVYKFACITREVCGNTCKPVEICMYNGFACITREVCGNTCKPVDTYVCIQICMHYQRTSVVIHANLWRYVCIQVCMHYQRGLW